MTMKQYRINLCALLLLFVITTASLTSARLFAAKQDEIMKTKEVTKMDSTERIYSADSIDEVMGMEACESSDAECLKRRMIAEVHLDYIYTQHHKP